MSKTVCESRLLVRIKKPDLDLQNANPILKLISLSNKTQHFIFASLKLPKGTIDTINMRQQRMGIYTVNVHQDELCNQWPLIKKIGKFNKDKITMT